MLPKSILQPHRYKNIYIDVFAIAHFMYRSLLKRTDENKSDLAIYAFNKGIPGNKSKLIYSHLAQAMVEFFNNFQGTNQNVYLLFDNPTSKVEARHQLSSSYKENRKSKMNSAFYKTIDFVQFYCTNTYDANFVVCRTPLREADDLVKVMLDEEKESSIMIANDSDWHACLREDPIVHQWWFTYGSDEKSIYTPKNFENEYHFAPTESAVVLYKAIMGDTADCIDPICKKRDLSEKELLHILNTYQDNPYSLSAQVSLDKEISPDAQAIIRESRAQLILNLKLVDRVVTPLDMLERYSWKGKNNIILKKALNKILSAASASSPLTHSYKFGKVKLEV